MATEQSPAASCMLGMGWSPHSYFTMKSGTQFSTCSDESDPDTDTSEQKHNQSKPAAVFSLILASSWLLFIANDIAVEPLAEMLDDLDVKALNGTDSSSPDYDRLLIVPDNTATFILAGAAFLLVAAVFDSAVRVVAAVAMCSGQRLALGALLGKARAQLKGPVLTLALVYALEIVYAALLSDMAALFFASLFLTGHAGAGLLLLRKLLLLAASVSLAYLAFLCAFSVAVAEPGCHGAAGAVRRAWWLLKGRTGRPAGARTFVIGGLVAAASHVHALARTRGLGDHLASWLLLWLLYIALMSAVTLLAGGGTIAAFYYELKDSAEAAAMEFVRMATEDRIDASSAPCPCHAVPDAC